MEVFYERVYEPRAGHKKAAAPRNPGPGLVPDPRFHPTPSSVLGLLSHTHACLPQSPSVNNFG